MSPDIYKIVISAIIASVLAAVIKRDNPVFAVCIAVFMSTAIFILIMPQLTGIINILKEISSQIDTGTNYILLVMKIIGIAYISEFGTKICSDAGEEAIASNIGLAGKVLIMAVSAPVVLSLLQQIIGMVSTFSY